MPIQAKRDKVAAVKFMGKLLKKHLRRHLISRRVLRRFSAEAMQQWRVATATA